MAYSCSYSASRTAAADYYAAYDTSRGASVEAEISRGAADSTVVLGTYAAVASELRGAESYS